VPTLVALAERGLQPAGLVADTTYGSGDNAVAAALLVTELISPVPVEDVAPAAGALTPTDFRVNNSYRSAATGFGTDWSVSGCGWFTDSTSRIGNLCE
jgi:hypothetical protein